MEQVRAGDARCVLAVDAAVQLAPSVGVRGLEDALLGGAGLFAAGADERFDGLGEDTVLVLLVRNDDVLARVDGEAELVVLRIVFIGNAECFDDLVRSGRDEDVFDGIAHRSIIAVRRRRFLRLCGRRVAAVRNEVIQVQGRSHGETGDHDPDRKQYGEETFHNIRFHLHNFFLMGFAVAIYGLQ